MCGRFTQHYTWAEVHAFLSVFGPPRNLQPHYNIAPTRTIDVIRLNQDGKRELVPMRWGLIPGWIKEASPRVKPINATAERVATAPMFRRAYAKRRCILPIDNFFEWKAIKGAKAKQPYAIGMKSGEPFALAAIWEGWRHPESGELARTFCVVTTDANELVADIHNRMPVILPPQAYDRWLSTIEPDPRDLLVPFPAEPMMMWPISTQVNKPENDDPEILEPFEAVSGSTSTLL